MKYEEALMVWGEGLLRERHAIAQDTEIRDISVSMDFDEGYACCGGSDPNCYCSFAESPRAEVVISGIIDDKSYLNGRVEHRIDHEDFDFREVLGAIVRAGGGSLTK